MKSIYYKLTKQDFTKENLNETAMIIFSNTTTKNCTFVFRIRIQIHNNTNNLNNVETPTN